MLFIGVAFSLNKIEALEKDNKYAVFFQAILMPLIAFAALSEYIAENPLLPVLIHIKGFTFSVNFIRNREKRLTIWYFVQLH